ncbi:unnamed protein product [Phaeothamnion confervicola]
MAARAPLQTAPSAASGRAFSIDVIPSDEERPVGPRGDEVKGKIFNRTAIVPPKGSGTKEMPIKVPSEFPMRVVGFEDPELHALYWFRLNEGALHYVEEIDKYFMLEKVNA